MPLDAAQRHKVLDWLRVKCPEFRCPACGAADWGVGDLSTPLEVPPPGSNGIERARGVLPGSSPGPLVWIGCNNCAYVAQFAAAVIGLTPRPPMPVPRPDDPATPG
jgi:hypothetical protein